MHPLMIALASLAQIVLINVVLSGDNALVIAMVARHLPASQRRAAMLWGGAVAIALRLALTLAVSYVLMIPGLRFVGESCWSGSPASSFRTRTRRTRTRLRPRRAYARPSSASRWPTLS